MLLTRAEATSYRETSLHADVMSFIAALAARGDSRLHVTGFGWSPEGRELPLLVLSARGVRTPAQARAAGLPVVLLLDGIHPGEVEGKEASLALVRDMLGAGAGASGLGELLEHMTLLVAPLFNPDGNDALDPANRRLDLAHLAGQPGPVVGTRTQSHGINLNRDYLRQAAPEMRLLQAGVCQPWAPDLTIDNHATNGSVHRFHMTVDVPHTVASGRREPIDFMRTRVVPDVMRAVKTSHGFDSGWYGNFVEDERVLDANGEVDPTTPVGLGWMTYPHHPRFGSNYRGLTNRLDILLECYSYLAFEERVATARAWQVELLRWVASHPDDIRNVVDASQRPPDEIAVRYRLEDFDPIEILTRTPRTLDGAPSTIRIPHRARFVGSTLISRPRAYAVPTTVAAHLARHGLRISPAPTTPLSLSIARIEALGSHAGRHILEASTVGDLTVSWRNDHRTLPPTYSLVPTDQPLGAIAVYLCEPESDDGAVENGLLAVPTTGDDYPIWRVL